MNIYFAPSGSKKAEFKSFSSVLSVNSVQLQVQPEQGAISSAS